ncbi:unnamed protein product [Schistocephalus solidus]|uniref:Secreted protein n=1 Tax=Schistocephalus solidus TaxID=70667 RepID=A0A183TFT8_SCHSO|nr:unnamed protein product [Schistocephalus solidus]
MLLWPPLTGTQLSLVAPRSWILPSGHTPGTHHDRRAKPGEGLPCCVCLHTCTPTPWDPSQVWWYTQGRLRLRQPPAPSPISGLLDSVLTLGSGMDSTAGRNLQAFFLSQAKRLRLRSESHNPASQRFDRDTKGRPFRNPYRVLPSNNGQSWLWDN